MWTRFADTSPDIALTWTGGGFAIMGRDEISILKEELVQLTVKSLRVVPNKNPTLLCSIWTKKSYNPNSFRAQMRSIWKTKKFEIQRCTDGVKLDPVSASPFWLKIGLCPPECDKKDLMHAIGSTFGGIMRLEIKEKVWIPFKHENLSAFCFGCGKMGHRGRKGQIQRSVGKGCWKVTTSYRQLPKGSPLAVRKLWHILKVYNPQVVFFMETKQSTRGNVLISLKSYSKYHVNVEILENEEGQQWRFMGFYGTPYKHNKEDSQGLLRNLGLGQVSPWLVCGDFNEILYAQEKLEGICHV
ncbi:hypothetical protein Golob_021665 [Gossypium lobatum]|uniref:Reverse transcriptase n=1 Tax=Gossypium lobatum TaxID=34289 RepID=A0A7J8LEA4_9ROSI|nr:hypothetical protein [Gossypium lobatum]